jgi:hypothetical protein
VVSQRPARKLRCREIIIADLAQAIATVYEQALEGGSNYVLRAHTEHEKPTAPTRLAEYMAFKRLQQHLPVTFIDPPAEHMVFDYIVNSKRWQLKLAHYNKPKDVWVVNCQKMAGRVNGVPTDVQYEVDDFDYLCIQLPEGAPNSCYVIPQHELAKRDLIGNANKLCGYVLVYSHRSVASRHAFGGLHWTEAYRVNLDQNPLPQLQLILDQSS